MKKDKITNLEIGKYFVIDNKKYKVVEHETWLMMCIKCDFFTKNCDLYRELKKIPNCIEFDRKDKKNVIFVEVK